MPPSKRMQRSSHTWIATIRDAVEAWRKANGWSRETAAQMIVEAHERAGLQQVSGIVFDPQTRDTYERMKVNADRIFRWLDDVTKDNNLMCANFIPSIIYALPADLRMHLVNDLLRDHGMACRQTANSDDVSATVRFPLPGIGYWERIIDKPERFGKRKATFEWPLVNMRLMKNLEG